MQHALVINQKMIKFLFVGLPLAVKIVIFALSVLALMWDENKQSRQEFIIANAGIALCNIFFIVYENRRRYKAFSAVWIAIWSIFLLLENHAIGTTFPPTLAAVAFSGRAVMLRLRMAIG